MKVTLSKIRGLVPVALSLPSTGNEWLDDVFLECREPYYKFFFLLATELCPSLSVELGTDRAIASAHLAYGNPTGTVITIDMHLNKALEYDKTQEALARFHNLHYIRADTVSTKAFTEVAAFAPIDLLFLDSRHHYDHVSQEWFLYRELLSSEALVIFDDVYDSPPDCIDMVRIWKEVIALGYEHFLDEKLHPHSKMGFVKYVSI